MAGSKGSKYYDIFLNYEILLEHKQAGIVLNDYTFQLLKTINEQGSLKAATDKMGISYRKAWGNIEEIENILSFKLVERQRGGTQGGKTSLTPDGIKLIDAHKSLRNEFDKALKEITRQFFHNLND